MMLRVLRPLAQLAADHSNRHRGDREQAVATRPAQRAPLASLSALVVSSLGCCFSRVRPPLLWHKNSAPTDKD